MDRGRPGFCQVDGKRIKTGAAPLYFAFHKPPGVITTVNDPQHRPDLTEFVAPLGAKRRVFPVGRLDFNSEGLLLLTNDGEFARRLTHPRFGVKKTYRVKLSACPTDRDLAVLRQGIRLEDGIAAPARARVVEKLRKNAWVEIEIHEGKNREVRRMFGALGYFVEKLIRIRVGAVSLAPLPRGELRRVPSEQGHPRSCARCSLHLQVRWPQESRRAADAQGLRLQQRRLRCVRPCAQALVAGREGSGSE